jgi:hypothetical protein
MYCTACSKSPVCHAPSYLDHGTSGKQFKHVSTKVSVSSRLKALGVNLYTVKESGVYSPHDEQPEVQ